MTSTIKKVSIHFPGGFQAKVDLAELIDADRMKQLVRLYIQSLKEHEKNTGENDANNLN